ncbi:MAG TPA: toprim domain-containing protein [Candidatus Paceibacterota bacterium]
MSILALVADDADIVALERSNSFKGRYFVLGGTLVLGNENRHGLRIDELLASLPSRIKEGLEEIVLALPAHPEGDATASLVRSCIVDAGHTTIKITSLGRGLSTGSELEYADGDTLRSALDNRK